MPNIHDNDAAAADIEIVGLGPGGLAAALQSAADGKKIVAFTDRNEYIRGQRLYLNAETIKFLKQHTDPEDQLDTQFWKKFSDDGGTAQTKDIERYLLRKLNKYSNVTIIHADRENPVAAVGKGESKNFIQLSNGEKYYTRNILAADGARHSFADLMNRDLAAGIHYIKTSAQERHRYHAVVQLKLKAGFEPPDSLLTSSSALSSYRAMSWDRFYKPKQIIFSNHDKTKFYFAGEIPKHIFEIKDPAERSDKLKKWASAAISEQFDITEDKLEYRISTKTPAKNRLQATVFEMEMMQTDKQIVDLADGVFAQIGDARRTPDYFFGHGLNDAIKSGVSFAKGVTEDKFEKDAYTTVIKELTGILKNA